MLSARGFAKVIHFIGSHFEWRRKYKPRGDHSKITVFSKSLKKKKEHNVVSSPLSKVPIKASSYIEPTPQMKNLYFQIFCLRGKKIKYIEKNNLHWFVAFVLYSSTATEKIFSALSLPHITFPIMTGSDTDTDSVVTQVLLLRGSRSQVTCQCSLSAVQF